jgi:hypothetical protein
MLAYPLCKIRSLPDLFDVTTQQTVIHEKNNHIPAAA